MTPEPRRISTRSAKRFPLLVIGMSLVLVATGCGSDKTATAAKVATLGTTTAATTDGTAAASTPADTQAALLAYASCMRDHGIDMPDPTFDANGNPTGGLFGRNSGIDRSTAGFQDAQTACGVLLKGITLGRGGGGLDRNAIQASMNDFTACLRDQGLDVNDITFGGGQGPAAGGGGFGGPPPTGDTPAGSVPAGATPADGSVPAGGGGFGGRQPNANGGGGGFDPTARIVERLGLDATDPAVTTAVDACKSILENAFQPTTTTTTTG
jgi:hypothetical protein